MDKTDTLKQFFGHASFRAGQEALVDAILGGRDVLGIMPTGGGKSVCYQLPALMLRGVTLVVSPLISLMKDQVMALKDMGIDAAFLNSSLSAEQMETVSHRLRAGNYKIVYIAPERLDGNGFAALAQTLDISLVAVDEAHCISQWGQDFRPSYLHIADFLRRLPQRPVVAAFTATATKRVGEDIRQMLNLRDPLCVTTGFDRPNLYFDVLRPKNKTATLQSLVKQRRGKCGIIYCATRSGVETLCDALRGAGLAATRYHAGLSDEERRKNQEDFLYDRAAVMVATNAFGMGIDKSNVGFVLHYNMPKSLEAYYQEAGRAGRDGEAADCILLYSAGDVQTARFFIQHARENEELNEEERQETMRRDYERLDTMVGYCKTTGCLRAYILRYFGQAQEQPCGNCGNCRSPFETRDITVEAQMILSCVKRASDRLGYCVGAALIAGTLCGAADRRVLQLGLDKLTTYGLVKNMPKARVRDDIEQLETLGYLRTDPVHGSLTLTPKAGNVLFHGETVEISARKPTAAETRHDEKRASAFVAGNKEESGLFDALKTLRFALARQENVPAYIVFSNATLADMAAKAPKTMAEFLEVAGVGEVKAARYGDAFLQEIERYSSENS